MTVSAPDIAIIGGAREAEVGRLAACLGERGHSPLIIDSATFPWDHHLSVVDGRWAYDDIDLASVGAWFLRSLHCAPLAENPAGAESHAVASDRLQVLREKDSLLGSLLGWAEARSDLLMNPLDTLKCHHYKLDTLERLRAAGVPVPPTLGTNSLEAARAFARRFEQIIYKPLAGGAEAVALSADDLQAGAADGLRIAPVMLQERIFGDDVRVYVLGDEVIAAGSLQTEHVDFRSGSHAFEPTSLSPEESADVIRAAKALSLRFTGIDFKRTADARHIVLDVNPAPMFAGFEQITGLAIADRIADALIAAVTQEAAD